MREENTVILWYTSMSLQGSSNLNIINKNELSDY